MWTRYAFLFGLLIHLCGGYFTRQWDSWESGIIILHGANQMNDQLQTLEIVSILLMNKSSVIAY